MKHASCDIGIIGLGTMGANLALNIAEQGFSVAGFDTDNDKLRLLNEQAERELSGSYQLSTASDLGDFISLLKPPRTVLLLVPVGAPVDAVIDQLRPHLEPDDIIIDSGNSHFTDTERRAKKLARSRIRLLGMGISGGSEGARHGPSMMVGGPQASWEHVSKLLRAASAKVDGSPCVAWLGRGSAGHYVKMVHNGIEYGIMQLIAETYDAMKRLLHLSHEQMHEIFQRWADGAMGGYLLEITAAIMLEQDALSSGYLLDKIRDAARQKGTGMWTSREAMESQVPTPVIDAAVSMRALSDYDQQRRQVSEILNQPERHIELETAPFVHALGEALHAAMIMTYAQGMQLLYIGSRRHKFQLVMGDVARIWRGGCIIRARLLEDLRQIYDDPNYVTLDNPMFHPSLAKHLRTAQTELREVVETCAKQGVPAPGFMSALSYYDAFRSASLPANLIQAQRDFFGAHTFERIDRDGRFHIDWLNSEQAQHG